MLQGWETCFKIGCSADKNTFLTQQLIDLELIDPEGTFSTTISYHISLPSSVEDNAEL